MSHHATVNVSCQRQAKPGRRLAETTLTKQTRLKTTILLKTSCKIY